MAIRIRHTPSAEAIAGAAYIAGIGAKAESDRQFGLQQQQLAQRERLAQMEMLSQQQALQQRQRGRMMENLQRFQLGALGQQLEQRPDLAAQMLGLPEQEPVEPGTLSPAQRHELARIDNDIARVRSNENLSDFQKDWAVRQLMSKRMGLSEPIPRTPDPEEMSPAEQAKQNTVELNGRLYGLNERNGMVTIGDEIPQISPEQEQQIEQEREMEKIRRDVQMEEYKQQVQAYQSAVEARREMYMDLREQMLQPSTPTGAGGDAAAAIASGTPAKTKLTEDDQEQIKSIIDQHVPLPERPVLPEELRYSGYQDVWADGTVVQWYVDPETGEGMWIKPDTKA